MFTTLFLIGFAVFMVFALVAAERSLRRQRGSELKRSREEQLAMGHIATNSARGAGGQGGA